MQAKLINHWSEFDGLSLEWNELLQSADANTLYLTWEWLRAWRESTGDRHTPFVVTVHDGNGKLAGVAPFYLSQLHLLNLLPFRTLRMMADCSTGAEYPNIIVKRGKEGLVYPAILECLNQNRRYWDCIWLPNWAGWDDTFSTFLHYLNQGGPFSCYHRPREFSYITLPASMDDFIAGMSKSNRYATRRVLKKFEAVDGLAIQQCKTMEELDTYLQTLFDLHYKRWSAAGEEGSFNRRPALKDFYHYFVPKALQNGWLRLVKLEHQGTPKAIQIGYLYDGVFHQVQEGFDPDFIDGAGNYLRLKLIERCIEEGCREYDFLGGFSEHKRRWGAHKRLGHDLFIWNKKLKNSLFSFKTIWPSGRYLSVKH